LPILKRYSIIHNMKIKVNIASLFYTTILIFPAFITGPIANFIRNLNIVDSSYPEYLTVLIIITPFVLLLKFEKIVSKRKYIRYIIILPILNTMWIINSSAKDSLTTIISISLPIYLAFLIVFYSNITTLLKSLVQFLNIFVLYLIVNISLFYLGYLPPNPQGRMGGSYAEIVTLAYTIAALLPLYYYVYKSQKTTKAIIVFAILFIALFATQTRGGVWISLAYLLYFLYDSKIKHSKYRKIILSLSIVMFFVIIFAHNSILNSKNDRLLHLAEPTRLFSLITGITAWIDQSIKQKFLGRGLNSFYDYQQWIRNGRDFYHNTFTYKGMLSLVQPHNSFTWLLVETGVIGALSLTYIFTRKVKLFNTGSVLLFYLNLTCFTFLLFNLTESIIIIYPNISILFWFITFLRIKLTIEQKENLYEKRNSNRFQHVHG